ncbi:NlpC/P60 family protein [Sphingomonas sp. AP4-R1]|uniref:C40 family peptidase n=1 Tax=Sphingomonas sp. AP4-R1 TaxID=2735134 RepID=UPI0034622896
MADIALAGRLFAPHYAAPIRCRLTARFTPVLAGPATDARAVSQLVLGEEFDIFDIVSGWAWGRCVHDDYVGYLPADLLGRPEAPTHRVSVPVALMFSAPDIKAPVLDRWPIGARFSAEADGAFLRTEAGYIHQRHACAIGAARDPLETAAALIGQPYLWGGRGGEGIDCSGLVQVACDFAGIACPRDSDMQRDSLGTPLADDEPVRAGDAIFFPGHVGLMLDGERLIHANAFAMAVTIEPLVDVVARLHQEPAPILARRRLK